MSPKQLVISTFLVVILGFVFVNSADAQYRDPRGPQRANAYTRPPTVSPYLNLLRRDTGFGPGLNYHTLVRPEQQFRGQLRRQQLEQERLQRQQRELAQRQRERPAIDPYSQPGANELTGESRVIRPTGHVTTWQNTLGYFGRR